MLLTAAPFTELTIFMQGILWIVLPVLFFSLLVTILIHYGRKRKTVDMGIEEEIDMNILGSTPENFCYKTEDGKLVFLDHTGLLREFKKKLSYSNARYAALKQDFGKLKSGELIFSSNNNLFYSNQKNIDMENRIDQHVQHSDSTENSIVEGIGIAQNDLDNSNLNEQSWLQDILEEKKKQIEFLQNQIDVRVKRNHIAEQERELFKNELEEFKRNQQIIAGELEAARNASADKDITLEKIKNLLDEKNEQLKESQQLVNTGQDRIIYLDNILTEIKEQNELLSAAVADASDKNESLNIQLEQEISKVSTMEMKLLANKQLLQRLFNEFSNCLQEETETSHLTAV